VKLEILENRSCLNCKYYDGWLCMYDYRVKAILYEERTAKECDEYVNGEYDEAELEKSNYK
jgi:hypothetical protein